MGELTANPPVVFLQQSRGGSVREDNAKVGGEWDWPRAGERLPFVLQRGKALAANLLAAEIDVSLRILDYNRPSDREQLKALVDRLRAQVAGDGHIADTVRPIIEEVRQDGDGALVKYMRKWTDPGFTKSMIRVQEERIEEAGRALDGKLREVFSAAIDHVRTYQKHIKPHEPPMIEIDGAQLGLRFTPIERVGLAVPGGTAAYPSSVIMLATPAQVAGVGRLAIVSPPPTVKPGVHAGDISPLVLAACSMLGLTEVYRIGGAQAMAALAFGTETVKPVDFIAGPGNAFVQMAKKQLFGQVGIDGFFGPSEIVALVDESANATAVAADLIAQAEHDPGCCFLIGTDAAVLERISQEVEKQIPGRKRKAAIEQALQDWSVAIAAPDEATALALVDSLAAEHVTLAVADPMSTMRRLNHGGAWFLGDRTPVASGDYYAGPSHCLPTGTTARYCSGLSVFTFLKRSSIERYPAGPGRRAIEHIAAFAEAEGLDGHAHSVRVRLP